MPFYRKKPVVIQAIQWTGENWPEIQTFCYTAEKVPGKSACIAIPTLEGTHLANIGDFVIKGVQDEFYPCKPDIFAATYEEV